MNVNNGLTDILRTPNGHAYASNRTKMQFDEFETFVKDGLLKVYDYTLLESNPLVKDLIVPDVNFSESKGKFLKQVLTESIESLKPIDKEYDLNAPEWRTYFVLTKRYVEGLNSLEVARFLSISERQYRRYLKRAINSISIRLWERYHQEKPETHSENHEMVVNQNFSVNWETVDLMTILTGVIDLLSNRLENEQIKYLIEIPKSPAINVKSDRIILRQILIGVLNHLMRQNVNNLRFAADQSGMEISLVIAADISDYKSGILISPAEDRENSLLFWSEKLNVLLEENFRSDQHQLEIKLSFIEKEQKTVMIVDDQEPALRMFTRYLSKTNLKIIGLSKGSKVIMKAKEIQPALILLDIMMPKMDGWEVLQSLKLDEMTKSIPVIVCSAWGEPELAISLGAVEFLRKPVRQRDLLATISKIGILD